MTTNVGQASRLALTSCHFDLGGVMLTLPVDRTCFRTTSRESDRRDGCPTLL